VDRLENYPWSSYPYYVSKLAVPEWLYCGDIYDQLLVKSRRREKYRAFVGMGVDEEIFAFYGKGNQIPYLGSDTFRGWAYRQRQTNESELNRKTIQSFRPTIEQVIDSVVRHFNVIFYHRFGNDLFRLAQQFPCSPQIDNHLTVK
jgi:hypothetical protein